MKLPLDDIIAAINHEKTIISDSSEFDVNACPLNSKVVAIAKDKYLMPVVYFPDQRYSHHNNIPKSRQDISYAYRKNSPKNYSAGDNINEKISRYHIKFRFVFYDVFGLDDEDLIEYGASSDSWMNSDASIGFTAWWQLQHQYAYAPLVTRIIIDKTYEVPTL